MSERNISFDTRRNYMKRAIYGSTTINMLATNTWYSTSVPMNEHISTAVVGANLTSTTSIWSNNYVHENMANPVYTSPPQLDYYWTDNTLYIRIYSGSGAKAQTGLRRVWYVTYYDYAI